jgi:putative ABC transport system ATP-binding protein
MITLRGLSKTYYLGDSELKVLQDINLNIETGEMVAIMGPSGSGKTTLLNLLGCLDRPTSGSYQLEGREVSSLSRAELANLRGRKLGFIFQSFNLLPYLSALDNVKLGMKYAGQSGKNQAEQALASVGLADRAKHRPIELSGGERQRVAIARAIVKNPPVILADEPTGNLDSKTGEEIIRILTDLNTNHGITMIVVTHDPDVAMRCRRTIRFKDGMIIEDKATAS